MEFKIITEDRYDDVIRHLRETFFGDEPLNKAAGLCCRGEGNPDLEKHSYETLHDNISLMAVTECDEIAAVVLNGILKPGDIERSRKKLQLCKDDNFKKIFNLLYDQNLKVDFFSHFNVDKVFEIRILSTEPKFRKQGLAKELVTRSEELARKCGFEVMKADATGVFSQRAFKSYNFDVIYEMTYTEYTDEYGNPLLEVAPPHTKLQLLYKCIN